MAKTELMYGVHSVSLVLSEHSERVLELFILKARSDSAIRKVIESCKRSNISIQMCNRNTLDKMTGNAQHQGLVAKVRTAKLPNESDLKDFVRTKNHPFLLLLDGITDPHNLGACIRTADAAGVDAVVVPRDKSATITPVVRKVACGAAEIVPFFEVTNLSRCIKMLQDQGIWVIGTAGEASQSIYEVSLDGSIALVMGAEGSGMRKLTKTTCDQLVCLPMLGTVSSLNVSVAAGVCLYEIMRQRTSA